MHGVAAAGFVAGKYLGKLIGTDKMADKLVGNKAAEESNASYTDAMKKQVEEQNKNRAISKGAFDSQVTAVKEKQKKGGILSATEQAILKASSDKNVITRGDRINTVMSAVNDAGDNLTKDDVNDAIDFIDVNLAQVEKEAADSQKNASTTFQDLAKKTEFYATGLFYNESFKTLVNSPTLAATEQALKMIRAERSRVTELQRKATFFTSSRYSVDLDALGILEHRLLEKRKILKEKEKYEQSKANLEKMKETAKDTPPPPPPPPLMVEGPGYDDQKNDKPIPLVDVNTGISEAALPPKNESNNNVELTKDKMVDGSSTYVDPSKLTDEEKENLLKSLKFGNSADNGLFGNLFRNYVQTSLEKQKKSYGEQWYERGDYPKFFTYYRQKWLTAFYENGKILRWKDDKSGVEELDKSEYSKAALDANLIRVMDVTPEVKQDTMLEDDNSMVESNIISDSDIDENMSNEERFAFNKNEEDRYNNELEIYKAEKQEFDKHKENATIENDEILKEAYMSYVGYMAKNEALGGSLASRKQLGKENWLKSYNNGTVLLGSDNGSIAMTKDEFFAKYYEQPSPPPPPTFYELKIEDKETGEGLSDQALAEEQEAQMLADNVESGESIDGAKTAINNAKDATVQAIISKEKSNSETSKAASQAAAAAASLSAQTAALMNPKSPDSIKNALITAMKNANENKEVVVYQSRRADNVMVKPES